MRASAAPRAPFDWPRALKDAGLVAGIVVLLALALVGARIQDASIGPPLAYRFDDIVAAALIAFLGRLGFAALRAQRAVPVLAGALAFVLLALAFKRAVEKGAGDVFLFDDATGRAFDIDIRGTAEAVVALERALELKIEQTREAFGKGRDLLRGRLERRGIALSGLCQQFSHRNGIAAWHGVAAP